MTDVIAPLSGHSILILLLQLTLLLTLARLLAELLRRAGQPAVLGELLAGILLGPSILGHYAPDVFVAIFPQESEQFHLLEAVSWLGMILLLLLTGLETDIRSVRHLGKAAVMASFFGLVIPFGSGLIMGWMLPDTALTDPANRPLFATFLATAMAISAMPVIAKILLDLGMMQRNFGLVTLSAAVVDDTVGWIILSTIAGISASGVFSLAGLGLTLLYIALFIAAAVWLLLPFLSRTIRYINERVDLAGADLTLILVVTFMSAAATEAIGIHAVFGAFVIGLVLRQTPRIKERTLHTLEVFVLSALAPIFFAVVGLRVDLWSLVDWRLPTLILAVAVAGKMIGCYAGGRLGNLSHWESVALGFGMNARGGMGLIVALIGLSLGLLTQELYASIVLVAVATSLMAPILIRAILAKLELHPDERRRIDAMSLQLLIPAKPLRVLVPTAGGRNALAAFALAAPLVIKRLGQVTALYVEKHDRTGKRSLFRRRSRLAGTNLDVHMRAANTLFSDGQSRIQLRQVRSADVGAMILEESQRDYDLLLLGAAPTAPLHDALTRHLVDVSRIPLVIVRHGAEAPWLRVLVAVDGSLFSRYAAEFAFAYAGGAGSEVTLLHVVGEEAASFGSDVHAAERDVAHAIEASIRSNLGALGEAHGVEFAVRVVASASAGATIVAESNSGYYDLLVLGAENKRIAQPLFHGQGTAEILERSGCATAVVVPRVD